MVEAVIFQVDNGEDIVHCRVQVREGEQRFLIAVVGSQVSLPCTESNTECSISTYRRLGPILSSIVRINHEDIWTLRRNRAAIYAREVPGSSRNREALVEDCTGVLCQVGVSTKRPRQCGAARACTLTRQGDLKLLVLPVCKRKLLTRPNKLRHTPTGSE